MVLQTSYMAVVFNLLIYNADQNKVQIKSTFTAVKNDKLPLVKAKSFKKNSWGKT